ncbi:MAG: Universal stress protein [Methanomassiliicoccales archaeon PtaU1.Bin124]|nr:MAG: Universal stress protein [Methanomassiliicoccales archaeon PtaU1.Bin124]
MTLYKRMLIATDGSENSRSAIEHGLEVAKLSNARVTAICVMDAGKKGKPDPKAEVMCQEAVSNVAELGRKMGIEVETMVVSGQPSNEIIKSSDEFDILVMGTTGKGGLANLLLGSVAQSVIRSAPCPVMVVRHTPDMRPAMEVRRRMLVPTDGSKGAKLAAEHAMRLAQAFEAEIIAMSVVDLDNRCSYDTCWKAVESVKEEGERLKLKVDVEVVTGTPFIEIVNASAKHDLIVMATSGRTGLAYRRLGSVAEKVIRQAKCPVIIVK